ncbi:hypothetical protein M885DRAFT_550658 [Pelagophyceae sp. CCMP2097]|nr:hypothetical protein M885DRAFT_550658 [Pelagophyceae sp. CCMP2097]|mmetsp:Transcript_21164/g.73020  ORF Transcript_21164/g.73020 Transcript_21164/m.73020 type:complete len:288 (+) Transcript_21164:101-964(+)
MVAAAEDRPASVSPERRRRSSTEKPDGAKPALDGPKASAKKPKPRVEPKKAVEDARAGAYEGELLDGLRHGLGKLTFLNGDVYEGQFRLGLRHGRGRLEVAKRATGSTRRRCYEGSWQTSLRHGDGAETWPSGERYEGAYRADAFHGAGTHRTRAGKYRGNFADGYKHGSGEMQYVNDDVYTGQWDRNRFHGVGTYVWASNSRYDGAWVQGLRSGFGTQVEPGGEKHEGVWLRGEKHGPGTVRLRNGRCRDGVWRSGSFALWTGAEYYGANTLKAALVVNAQSKKDP